jgi:hypothetical protein
LVGHVVHNGTIEIEISRIANLQAEGLAGATTTTTKEKLYIRFWKNEL